MFPPLKCYGEWADCRLKNRHKSRAGLPWILPSVLEAEGPGDIVAKDGVPSMAPPGRVPVPAPLSLFLQSGGSDILASGSRTEALSARKLPRQPRYSDSGNLKGLARHYLLNEFNENNIKRLLALLQMSGSLALNGFFSYLKEAAISLEIQNIPIVALLHVNVTFWLLAPFEKFVFSLKGWGEY